MEAEGGWSYLPGLFKDHPLYIDPMAFQRAERSRVYQDGVFVGVETSDPFRHVPNSSILNFRGDSSLKLSLDRTRYIEHDPLKWFEAFELYSIAIEQVFQQKFSSYTALEWWAFHAQHLGLSQAYLPHALEGAAHQSATFCVFSHEGCSSANLSGLRTWSHEAFVVGLNGHDDLRGIQDLIPRDVRIVAIPPGMDHRHFPWFWSLTGLNPNKGL